MTKLEGCPSLVEISPEITDAQIANKLLRRCPIAFGSTRMPKFSGWNTEERLSKAMRHVTSGVCCSMQSSMNPVRRAENPNCLVHNDLRIIEHELAFAHRLSLVGYAGADRLRSRRADVGPLGRPPQPEDPSAIIFMDDLAARLANRVQLTSDGHKPYLEAVEGAFGGDIDYAMLVKVYGPAPEGQRRYSPAECIGAHKHRVEGDPDPKHVSTSYSERNNLNIRMHTRRMTRLTNAFSKKVENHAHAMALHFMYYNFVRIHTTLRMTPAMAAGVSKRLWEMSDIVDVLETWEAI